MLSILYYYILGRQAGELNYCYCSNNGISAVDMEHGWRLQTAFQTQFCGIFTPPPLSLSGVRLLSPTRGRWPRDWHRLDVKWKNEREKLSGQHKPSVRGHLSNIHWTGRTQKLPKCLSSIAPPCCQATTASTSNEKPVVSMQTCGAYCVNSKLKS